MNAVVDRISSEDPFGFKPLWNAILEVYEVFRLICAKYGLRHFATGGTAIGALRHKGFIPWDDDFDVAMPRPDYERFLKIVEDELPSNLKLVNWKNTKEFGLTFSKIQETRRSYVESVENACGFVLSNGIYLDIFPIDGDKKPGTLASNFMRFKLKFIAALERFHCHSFMEQSRAGKIGWILGMVISPFCPFLRTHHQCLSAIEKIITANPYEDDERTFQIGQGLTCYVSVEAKGVWKEMKEVSYERTSIMISSRCEDYLRAQFGDFMTPPPVELRRPSHSNSRHVSWWLGPTGE